MGASIYPLTSYMIQIIIRIYLIIIFMPKESIDLKALNRVAIAILFQLKDIGYTGREIARILNRSQEWVWKKLSTRKDLTEKNTDDILRISK